MIKRRTLWIAPTILAMLGLLGFCSIDWLKVEEMRVKPNTLRSRVLVYERELRTSNRNLSDDQVTADVTRLMESYFKIGMSEEECVRILLDNDLRVDEKYYDVPAYQIGPQRVFFAPSIVARVDIPSGNFILTLQYRLILRFLDKKLYSVSGARSTSGP